MRPCSETSDDNIAIVAICGNNDGAYLYCSKIKLHPTSIECFMSFPRNPNCGIPLLSGNGKPGADHV